MKLEILLPIITTFVVLLVQIWLFQRKRFLAASDTFRAAFSDALLNLNRSDVPLAQVVASFRMQHLNAIQSFRPHLNWLSMRKFDKAEQQYDDTCTLAEPQRVTALFMSEQTGPAQQNRQQMIDSIQHLLTFAK